MKNVTSIYRALKLAIGREIAARKFYSDIAARSSNPAVKELFKELAGEEAEHRKALEKVEKDPRCADKFKAPAIDYKIAETEEAPDKVTDLSPKEAVALAMKKEQQAVDLYRAMAAAASDPSVRLLFQKLADMELGHKHKLEEAFVNVGYPEVF